MNKQQIIESVTEGQLKSDFPAFSVGDTLDVHVRIIEGDKERVQVYQGVLIAEKGRGVNRTEGVERIFPLHSPRIAKIEVVRRGDDGRPFATASDPTSTARAFLQIVDRIIDPPPDSE